MTNKKFKELKKVVVDRCKERSACAPEFRRLKAATTEAEILKVLYDNRDWCQGNKIITQDWLVQFTPEILLASGLANTGSENTGFGNSGYRNSGDRNSGDRNSGDRNSGDRNSGDRNSGDRNSGDSNSGDSNSGDSNSGDSNSGDSNSGDSNSGDRNSGDSNSGYRNSGYRNSGDCNSGNFLSGVFCTDKDPKIMLFDSPSDLTYKQWRNTKASNILVDLFKLNQWVFSQNMTEQEKKENPSHETTGGFLRTVEYKKAWSNMWEKLTEGQKEAFTSLPNFDKNKFNEITGINI